jgi:hypothetical protein
VSFPIRLTSTIEFHDGSRTRSIVLNRGLTVLLGPNGSGKTHFLRGLKRAFGSHLNGKKARFLSAGRMGLLEQYRSDHDGQHGGAPRYDAATYGSKGDSVRRHDMESLTGDLHTLAERTDVLIKIQERLRKLFQRDVIVEWDGGRLKVLFSHLDVQSRPYSSGREASGLMHLVGILAALYDDEVGVLLLDEPEVSLHPQLQAFLLKEILSVAGVPSEGSNKKFVVIATHSTEMIQVTRPDDLLSLVFCHDLSTDPVQIPADAGELKNKKLQGLIARLGQEHKLSLFCKRPLLVEGPSDVLICSALSIKADLHLEASGSQLLPVIGKGQMPIVAKLFRLLGKEPVALADADGIADGLDLVNQYLADCPTADHDAGLLGFASAAAMASTIYADFCKVVQNRWGELADKAEAHPYWVNRNNAEEAVAKRRAAFSVLFSSTDNNLPQGSGNDSWLAIKTRLLALLTILEKSGLFVLRRGSIESYYQRSDTFTSIGKPSAAADEMEHISQLDDAEIHAQYDDILRCVQFAARTDPIREAEALRDLLLAVAAPAHARLKDDHAASDLNLLARSILGERSRIFDLSVENDALEISLASKILNVDGFPIVIKKTDDVVQVISTALAGNA